MIIDTAILCNMLRNAAELFHHESLYLGEIDSKFGDGDHGVTMAKIADVILQAIKDWNNESIHDFLEELASRIMAVNGGSAGPLYGTIFAGMALALNDETEIGAELLKKMFISMQSEMEDVTKARLGDKTMMDALIPAVTTAVGQNGDIPFILQAAAAAAKDGADKTKDYVSKFGRAKSYKEQTIGTPDAGAISTSLLFYGFAKGVL